MKVCGCCGRTFPDVVSWERLPFVGIQHVPADETGPEIRLELRNCSCGTTLVVELVPVIAAEAA